MLFLRLICMMVIASSLFAKEHNVVVIGGGIAGLTAAYRLNQNGIDVHLYEARGRVGGRIFSATIDGRIGELGAQNISDGGDAINLHRLIDEFGIEIEETNICLNRQFYWGKQWSSKYDLFKNIPKENLSSYLDSLAKNSASMRDVLIKLAGEEDDLYGYLSVRLAAYEGASVEHLSPLYTTTLYHMLRGGLASAHQREEEIHASINFQTIRGGNSILPQKMAEALGSRVHLNAPLVSISKTSDDSYELTFADGDRIKAESIILAIPSSVYADLSIEEGIIPEKRLQDIQNVRYGTNAKILVPISETISKRDSFSNERIVAFFDASCQLITLYYTGESGRFSDVLESYLQNFPLIETGLGPLCPPRQTPQLARDEQFAIYNGPVGYSWPNDRYVKGSYSYIAAGQEELLTSLEEWEGETVKSLFAPIGNTLYFAGEHASILMDAPGTMEAGCESGERAARMIIRAQQKLRTPF